MFIITCSIIFLSCMLAQIDRHMCTTFQSFNSHFTEGLQTNFLPFDNQWTETNKPLPILAKTWSVWLHFNFSTILSWLVTVMIRVLWHENHCKSQIYFLLNVYDFSLSRKEGTMVSYNVRDEIVIFPPIPQDTSDHGRIHVILQQWRPLSRNRVYCCNSCISSCVLLVYAIVMKIFFIIIFSVITKHTQSK